MDMEEKRVKKGVAKGWLVLLGVLLIFSLAAGGFVVKKHMELKDSYDRLEENKDDIVKSEVEAKLSEVKTEEKERMLEEFRKGLSGDESTLSFLRNQYQGKYLVYQLSSKYLFEPVLDVEMADYSGGEFVTDSQTGLRSFQKDGKAITKHVIDVSKYQGDIDWKSVKESGIEGAIIRAGVRGYGSGEVVADAKFDENMKNAIQAGMDTGAYFFSEAVTQEEAKEEAEFLLNAVKPYKVKLPLVLDLEMIDGDTARNESLSKEELTKVALTFMETIKAAGYEAMLYGNIRTISEMIDLTQFEDYKLWFAYYSDDIYVPYKFDMWQYASDGKVKGITTDCDVNMMFIEES